MLVNGTTWRPTPSSYWVAPAMKKSSDPDISAWLWSVLIVIGLLQIRVTTVEVDGIQFYQLGFDAVGRPPDLEWSAEFANTL